MQQLLDNIIQVLYLELCNLFIQVFSLSYVYLLEEQQWKKEWFSNIPNYSFGYWKDPNNQRKFLEEFARKYGIKDNKDWGEITGDMVKKEGAATIISLHGSLRKALEALFPGKIRKVSYFLFEQKSNGSLVGLLINHYILKAIGWIKRIRGNFLTNWEKS